MKKYFFKSLFLGVFASLVACNPAEPELDQADFQNGSYVHKVVVEDFTGTWCGNCPRIGYAISKAEESYHHHLVAVGIHLYGNDPYIYQPGAVLLEKLSNSTDTGLPYTSINRGGSWISPETENIEYPKTKVNPKGSPIGIKISSDLEQNKGKVSFDVIFETPQSDLKYVVYLMEDKLVHDQSNYTNFYSDITEKKKAKGYIHNDVVRTSSDILGTDIPNDKAKANNIFSVKDLHFDYKSEKVENLKVAVIILNKDGNVLNAQVAKANTVNDFELNH